METMTAHGHGVELTLTPTELRARGAAFPAELVLPLRLVVEVVHTPPAVGGLVKGCLGLLTDNGKRYQMHYGRRHKTFGALAEALSKAVRRS